MRWKSETMWRTLPIPERQSTGLPHRETVSFGVVAALGIQVFTYGTYIGSIPRQCGHPLIEAPHISEPASCLWRFPVPDLEHTGPIRSVINSLVATSSTSSFAR